MTFYQYSEYKKSGVEWLGDVPDHWEIVQFKQLVDIQNGSDYKQVEQDEGYPVYGSGGVFTHASQFLYDGESVLLGRKGTIDKPLHVAGRFWTVDTMYWTKVKVGSLARFVYYSALTIPFAYYATNTALPSITSGALKAHVLLRPPLEEQVAISDFLDRETSAIDALVAEQRRLMELLKEKRQAVISHAVTKGLNADAPMKPSGIEWLGDVPAHWTVAQIKHFTTTITDGAHISPDTADGIFPFVSTRDVANEIIDFDNCLKTSQSSFECMLKSGCNPLVGDILFSKDGTIGKTAVVRERRDFAVASSLIIIRPNGPILDPNFLNLLCQSTFVISQVDCCVRGAGLPRLSVQSLRKVIGCFPPFFEQRSISGNVDGEIAKLDALREETQRGVDLLKERRASLISAAVTGQIDVRNIEREDAP